jgi:hypothetical protein
MAQQDMRMTQLTPQAAPPTEADQRRQRRSESLFTRITGFGLIRPSTSQHEEDLQETHTADDHITAQPHLNVNPSDRPTTSSQEDMLEIPAFLRRQNNH